jgi:hypothetical protein
MKKILILAFGLTLGLILTNFTPVKAQTVLALSSSTGNDTLSGSGTSYLYGRVFGTGTVALQLNAIKVSGTVGGYAIIQASIDANYSPVQWADVVNTAGVKDTLTLADGNNFRLWTIPHKYLHYRIKIVRSGTQVFTAKGYVYGKSN